MTKYVFGICLLSASALAHAGGPCPADSVLSGTLCVDKYEVSAWETTNKPLIQRIQKGKLRNAASLERRATRRGDPDVLLDVAAGVADYSAAGCPRNAEGCTNLYAASVPGVKPSIWMNWFQAVAACRNSGKRLPTNEEWTAAALGPDRDDDDLVTTCNTQGGTRGDLPYQFPVLVETGSRSLCVSDVGVFDMSGNLEEYTSEWLLGPTAPGSWGGFSDDLFAAETRGVLVKGGNAIQGRWNGPLATATGDRPEIHAPWRGFRCVRNAPI